MNEKEKLNLYLRNVSEGAIRKRFQSNILDIFHFWYELIKIQNRDMILNSYRRVSAEIRQFLLKYTTNTGHYMRKYSPFIVGKDMQYDPRGNQEIRNNPALLIDIYKPSEYAKRKLSYDYYKIMAMFEQAQNERIHKAREACVEKGTILGENEYREIEEHLQEKQFMWLRQQLSWLGLDDAEHDPNDPEHWITSKLGQAPKARQELDAFLSKFKTGDILSKEQEDRLKELYRNWIQNARPKHKDANSRGSIAVINRCFEDYKIPYHIESKKKMIAKKQRNWWVIEKL